MNGFKDFIFSHRKLKLFLRVVCHLVSGRNQIEYIKKYQDNLINFELG